MNAPTQPVSPWGIDPAAFPRDGTEEDRLRFLVRYALLAPSTRNTQPWRFHVTDGAIDVHLDLSRWQRVADADQREMHISIGCALENLLVAAAHFGYRTAPDCLASCPHPTLVARVRCMPGDVPEPSVGDPRFEAMLRRRTELGAFDGSAIGADVLAEMAELCIEPGLRLDWMTGEPERRAVDDLVTRADALLLSRSDYRRELAEVITAGAFGTAWLMSTVGRMAVAYLKPTSGVGGAHRAAGSPPMIGVISARTNTPESQIRVGQVLERLYLQSTMRDLCLQPVSQIVQTDDTREALTTLLPEPGWMPLQPLRLGRAEASDHRTPRRSLEEVLMEEG